MQRLTIVAAAAFLLLLAGYSNEPAKTEVITLAETSQSWNGAPLPDYPDGKPQVTILKIIIPPKTALHMHQHPHINAGVLLSGALTVISEQHDTLYLKAGEPIVELINTWHFGKNEGDEPAEIIVFYAGIVGTPITILKEDK